MQGANSRFDERNEACGNQTKEVNYGPAKSFEDLQVWRKAHGLVLNIYKATLKFPRSEIFGLSAQLKRSAASIPANMAEAFGRRSKADKLRILNIAEGSLQETRYHLLLAEDLGYGDMSSLISSLTEVGKMLQSYMSEIRFNAGKINQVAQRKTPDFHPGMQGSLQDGRRKEPN